MRTFIVGGPVPVFEEGSAELREAEALYATVKFEAEREEAVCKTAMAKQPKMVNAVDKARGQTRVRKLPPSKGGDGSEVRAS